MRPPPRSFRGDVPRHECQDQQQSHVNHGKRSLFDDAFEFIDRRDALRQEADAFLFHGQHSVAFGGQFDFGGGRLFPDQSRNSSLINKSS